MFRRLVLFVLLALALGLAGEPAASAQTVRHELAGAGARPGAVVLDGDLADWAGIPPLDFAYDQALAPRFSGRLSLMYDAGALYVGAHIVDDSPLVNQHRPSGEGCDGDCLRLHVATTGGATSEVSIWYSTPAAQPVMEIRRGPPDAGARPTARWSGRASGAAFRRDADGAGYTLEARLPWDRLGAARPPRAGDRLPMAVEPRWGDRAGLYAALAYFDLVSGTGLVAHDPGLWGQVALVARGGLWPVPPVVPDHRAKPLSLVLPRADPAAVQLSAAVFDARGELVRTLPVQALTPGDGAAKVALRWDGLDDDGRALPAGRYTVETLTHRGIGQRWVTSIHNPGDPPWRVPDGTGQWGGDHGPPVAAAADGERVYLGWEVSEAGSSEIAVRPELAAGKPRKLWGQRNVLEISPFVTAMAAQDGLLFVAQDGIDVENRAGVVLWDGKTGRPVSFPFGQRVLEARRWKHDLVPARRPLYERVKSGDVGPPDWSPNVKGLAVSGSSLYVSLGFEDTILELDWKTGRQVRAFSVPRPAGLAVDGSGRLLAVSDRRLVRVDTRSGAVNPVVTAGLSYPWGVAVDRAGNVYVTDQGSAMDVKVFDATGRLLRTVGKPGGRPWIGRYDPEGMLLPAGIAVDREGKIWVTEHDDTPRRVSVWAPDGRLVADLQGAGNYSTRAAVDLDHPSHVVVHGTLYDVDYARGTSRCVATWFRPDYLGPQAAPFRTENILSIGTARGRTWVYDGFADVLYDIEGDRAIPRAHKLGDAEAARLLPAPLRERRRSAIARGARIATLWSDRNGDGLFQPDEVTLDDFTSNRGFVGPHSYWGLWMDDDLAVWGGGGGQIYRIPIKEWTAGGVPVPTPPSETRAIFEAHGHHRDYVMPDGDDLYVLEQEGGDDHGGGALWSAVSRYTGGGRRLWAYRRTWPGFAPDAPLYAPGDVIGAIRLIGSAHLPGGAMIIAVNGYDGQDGLLSGDGLWIAALGKDLRQGPLPDRDTVWAENFNGTFFRNKDDGKVYLIGGDTDARIWEVTGLDAIRTGHAPLVITEAEHGAAVAASARASGLPAAVAPLAISPGATPDPGGGVRIDAGAGRAARVALAYDATSLHLAFDVATGTPRAMSNGGKDYALLFHDGDACDFMLAAPGGDVRLLFTMLDGKPVAVLYEPRGGGGGGSAGERRTFRSPTGLEEFQRVALLREATVTVRRTGRGYRLDATVPLAAIPLPLTAGRPLRGDVGVLFSDASGTATVLRAYYYNRDTAVVNDLPTEARLVPARWGLVDVR
jgi:hypothetical protein